MKEVHMYKERVVVALSGGVDSAVVAWMLKDAGYEVIGVSLRLAPETSSSVVSHGRCCSVDDMSDARRVCDSLGIPFFAIDARERFKKTVFEPFIQDYKAGRTPIPCLACNYDLKFGDLFKTAQMLSAKLATGHYACVVDYKGVRALARPLDERRDQTYYLYGTKSEVVENLLLPLGVLHKPAVRELAKQAGFTIHNKPDSQEICFVPDGDHAAVIERAQGAPPAGEVVDMRGQKLGQHAGIHRFTVGQRRGVGVASEERLYVVDVDSAHQRVRLGPREALACSHIVAGPLLSMVPMALWPPLVRVQTRARGKAVSARWRVEENSKKIFFDFLEPVYAVALGQAAVAYDGEILLGGGTILGRLDGCAPRVDKVLDEIT